MKYLFLPFVLALIFSACRSEKAAPAGASSAEPETGVTTQASGQSDLPPDFLEFYRRFHADSLYQIEHIQWPLEGQTSYSIGDTTQGPQQQTHWQRENWRMHHDFSREANEFNRTFERLGDVLVIEKIRAKLGNYGLERRFSKQSDGSWLLIYYSDMHELGK